MHCATSDTEYYYSFTSTLFSCDPGDLLVRLGSPRQRYIFKKVFTDEWIYDCYEWFINILARHYLPEDGEILGSDTPGTLARRPTEELI